VSWRDLPPTYAQERVLRRWGTSAKTRGEASDMITAVVERAKAREKAFADAGVDDDYGWEDMPPLRDWGDL
jgi:hypothetical protein